MQTARLGGTTGGVRSHNTALVKSVHVECDNLDSIPWVLKNICRSASRQLPTEVTDLVQSSLGAALKSLECHPVDSVTMGVESLRISDSLTAWQPCQPRHRHQREFQKTAVTEAAAQGVSPTAVRSNPCRSHVFHRWRSHIGQKHEQVLLADSVEQCAG